ncbi:beta-1,3-glucan-binding protein-like [Frankliniella occidentalis]|uniref:Beta-1,3-glucan-binding protein-like n=1 Tax=Frankliniella occidentalis TaxID=133901 RepID=A0A9C6TWW5_FRAOC|nr:beta-1,3-glucan-binding protein-like [Frankliniella occidentalis]
MLACHAAGRGRPRPRLITCTVGALAALALLLLCAPAGVAADGEYEVPDPIIKAFSPKGLSVSIPDSEGVELFAFHGNVNRELGEREAGEMSMDIRKKSKEGLWTYQSQRKLKVGDVINYWLYVQRFGRGYERLGQTFYVTELARDPGKVDESEPPKRTPKSGQGQGSSRGSGWRELADKEDKEPALEPTFESRQIIVIEGRPPAAYRPQQSRPPPPPPSYEGGRRK